MHNGIEHLAGTGSRVSEERLREKPLSLANAQTDTHKPRCKAMTPECMGDKAYEEYIRPKPRQRGGDPKPPSRTTFK